MSNDDTSAIDDTEVLEDDHLEVEEDEEMVFEGEITALDAFYDEYGDDTDDFLDQLQSPNTRETSIPHLHALLVQIQREHEASLIVVPDLEDGATEEETAAYEEQVAAVNDADQTFDDILSIFQSVLESPFSSDALFGVISQTQGIVDRTVGRFIIGKLWGICKELMYELCSQSQSNRGQAADVLVDYLSLTRYTSLFVGQWVKDVLEKAEKTGLKGSVVKDDHEDYGEYALAIFKCLGQIEDSSSNGVERDYFGNLVRTLADVGPDDYEDALELAVGEGAEQQLTEDDIQKYLGFGLTEEDVDVIRRTTLRTPDDARDMSPKVKQRRLTYQEERKAAAEAEKARRAKWFDSLSSPQKIALKAIHEGTLMQPKPFGGAALREHAIIVLPESVWTAIKELCRKSANNEVGWFGTMTQIQQFIFLDEIFLPEQTVGPATTDITGLAGVGTDLVEQDRLDDFQRLRFWGHCHPGDGVTPSGTDEDTFSEQVGDLEDGDKIFLMGIFSKSGQIAYWRLHWHGLSFRLGWAVLSDQEYDEVFPDFDKAVKSYGRSGGSRFGLGPGRFSTNPVTRGGRFAHLEDDDLDIDEFDIPV